MDGYEDLGELDNILNPFMNGDDLEMSFDENCLLNCDNFENDDFGFEPFIAGPNFNGNYFY